MLSFSNLNEDDLNKFIEREKKENEQRINELKDAKPTEEVAKDPETIKKKGLFGRFFSWIGNFFKSKKEIKS